MNISEYASICAKLLVRFLPTYTCCSKKLFEEGFFTYLLIYSSIISRMFTCIISCIRVSDINRLLHATPNHEP